MLSQVLFKEEPTDLYVEDVQERHDFQLSTMDLVRLKQSRSRYYQ